MSEIAKLEGPEVKPASGKDPKYLGILLHGLGADGNDLISLAPYFAENIPDMHFISPHAPFKCDMAPFGYQWFSLQDRSQENILNGVKHAAPILENFIKEQKNRFNLDYDKIVLIGFSQGTMLSLYTSLRLEKPLAGVLGYSGALVAPHLLKDETKSIPNLCLIHGEADNVVPFEAFNEALSVFKSLGIEAEAYSSPDLGHGIDPAGIKIGAEFIKKSISQ